MENNWIQDWSQHPTTDEEFEMWKVYCVLWKDAQLTPPGFFVNAWLKFNGMPSPSNDPHGFFRMSMGVYMYRDNKLRSVA